MYSYNFKAIGCQLMDNQKSKVHQEINSQINHLSDNCVTMIFVTTIIIATKTYDVGRKLFIIRSINLLLIIPKIGVQSQCPKVTVKYKYNFV